MELTEAEAYRKRRRRRDSRFVLGLSAFVITALAVTPSLISPAGSEQTTDERVFWQLSRQMRGFRERDINTFLWTIGPPDTVCDAQDSAIAVWTYHRPVGKVVVTLDRERNQVVEVEMLWNHHRAPDIRPLFDLFGQPLPVQAVIRPGDSKDKVTRTLGNRVEKFELLNDRGIRKRLEVLETPIGRFKTIYREGGQLESIERDGTHGWP